MPIIKYVIAAFKNLFSHRHNLVDTQPAILRNGISHDNFLQEDIVREL